MEGTPLGKQYVPILRTRDAEMKGIENASSKVIGGLLPVFELTQSRRSKSNATGAVSLCADRVAGLMGERPFIVDVTSLRNFQNEDVLRLLNQEDGFANWCQFVLSQFKSNCIPIIHLTDPLDQASIELQVRRLKALSGYIAIRLPLDYEESEKLQRILLAELGGLGKVVLIADAGFIVADELAAPSRQGAALLADWHSMVGLSAIASSGFPNSVVPKYGTDAYGKFDLAEVVLSDRIRTLFPSVVHGDYALIHPNDFDGIVTNWVPRVDVPLAQSVFYHRYRREAGGYVMAAQKALSDKDYVTLKCWADQNIREAADGDPQGRNPAHWIAVRVNFHLHRQHDRLAI